MDSSPRQQQIVKRVLRDGFVPIDALADAFSVTSQTIRRDVNRLVAQGLLSRHHGGAGVPSSVENVAYRARKVLQLEAKQRIGRALAREIPDRASLFMTLGTTTEEVARALLQHDSLRVITNNLNIATILSNNPSFEVIITGGVVRHRDRGIIGEAACDFIRQFRVDYGVTGISGIAEDGTLLDFDYREVRVVQAIRSRSRQFWVAADNSKFGRNAMVEMGCLQDLDALFTDSFPDATWGKLLADNETRLVVAAD